MGLYNFQKRFAAAVLAGTKTHTIRGKRARPDKPGNTLHLYTGLRQKGARLLMRAICTKVEHISIYENGSIGIDGCYLAHDERETLAQRDGFANHAEMMTFWEGRLPFVGDVIHWRKPSCDERAVTDLWQVWLDARVVALDAAQTTQFVRKVFDPARQEEALQYDLGGALDHLGRALDEGRMAGRLASMLPVASSDDRRIDVRITLNLKVPMRPVRGVDFER